MSVVFHTHSALDEGIKSSQLLDEFKAILPNATNIMFDDRWQYLNDVALTQAEANAVDAAVTSHVPTASPTPVREIFASMVPNPGQVLDLGSSAHRWGDVFATSLITLSDSKLKVDIEPISTPSAMELVMNCQPVSYRMKDFVAGEYGEQKHRRRHFGFIAQQVAGVLGDSADECGIWCCDAEGNQSLRYEQFIAPLLKCAQAQQQKIEQQEAQISYCLETIQAIQTVLRERPIFE